MLGDHSDQFPRRTERRDDEMLRWHYCASRGDWNHDEFFEAITLKQLGLISSPLVLLNTDHFYNPLYDYLCKMADLGFMSENCLRLIRVCDTPEEALSSVLTPDSLKGSIRRLQDYSK